MLQRIHDIKILLRIKKLGLVLFLKGLSIFTALIFFVNFKASNQEITDYFLDQSIDNEVFEVKLKDRLNLINSCNIFQFSDVISNTLETVNDSYKSNKQWDKVVWISPQQISFDLAKKNTTNFIVQHSWKIFFMTIGLGILGSLLYIYANAVLEKSKGIYKGAIYKHKSTNKGWIAWLTTIYLIGFYLILYFRPNWAVNWTFIIDPISEFLNGQKASQWFLYGFLYCMVMLVMGVRMLIKYQNNNYQKIRTICVVFFQIVFAFLIPEIMTNLGLPAYDFKNAFPLDYDFFFDWNLDRLLSSGNIGLFILVWGVFLTLVIVPIFVYFFGKRWYCSWVCGCGGLAETLGDPYRQHSNKTLNAWKWERLTIYSVLLFSLFMTLVVLYTYIFNANEFLGFSAYQVRGSYSFLIGSWFSGVIGTGFYPIFGNRIWCRFGCPLAAYMGIIQKFKSKFRITVNGSQCISCGNCSTFCEQGIDVRSYAQRNKDIVRASCVGCGICSSVCPRGVLKLENIPLNCSSSKKI